MGEKIVLFFIIAMLVIGAPIHVFAETADAPQLVLTEQEKAYFSQLKSLRVLTAPGGQPYSYRNTGVSIDILERLCEAADVALEVIEAESYADALTRLENGEAELAAVKISIQKDESNILPYLQAPMQMVYHNRTNPLEQSSFSLAHLNGLNLPNDKASAFTDILSFASVRDCLGAVRSQLTDIFLCDIYQLSVFSGSFTAWDLEVTTIPRREISIGFGLQTDTDVRLISALQRAMDAFLPSELSDSLMRHLQYQEVGYWPTQFVYQNPFEVLCVISALFFIVLLCVYVSFRIRSSQHQELRGYEESYRMLAETFGEAGLEYDYLSDRLTFFGDHRNHIDLPEVIEQAHAALQQGALRLSLTPEELDKLLQNNAQDQSYQVELQCGTKEGNWNWFRMIYIVVCTSESHRRPIRLIGCLMNIEEEHREKERLVKIGYRDQLTGLLNRASGEYEMIRGLEDTAVPKVLLFLDIDYFKNFNDRYGHSCGDAVLNALGTALSEIFSEGDLLCRWGGDEFILLIKGDGAMEHTLSGNLRKLQEKMQVVSYSDNSLSVTLSIGGVFVSPERPFPSLLEAADEILYAVKKNGRNSFRIIYQTDTTDAPSTEVSE